jgi:alpha-D-xyloside xylohydrolase
MFYDTLVKFIELRYSFMPYIYSLAADAWYNDGTIMRMLAFDFMNDKKALEIKDQYMFGKNIMVCPVTSPMYYDVGSKPVECNEYSRTVYLPEGTKWYDFWTNKIYDGGQYIKADADISKIPLFVREGSIIPMIKPTNYAGENPGAPIELRVYTGRDCEFMLYDDGGDGYMYEKGEYSLINIKWDDKAGQAAFETINRRSSDNDITARIKINKI